MKPPPRLKHRAFPLHQKVFLWSFADHTPPPLWPCVREPMIYILSSQVNFGLVLYILFYVWLLLLIIICLGLIHIAVCVSSLFFLLLSSNPFCEYITTCWFTHILVDIYPSNFSTTFLLYFFPHVPSHLSFYSEDRESDISPGLKYHYEFLRWLQATCSILVGHTVKLLSLI